MSIDERTDDELTDEMILRRVVGEFLGATREEIARRSGLSESAVSRFVHARLKLSPDARASLEEIVEELIKNRGIEIAHATHLLDEAEANRQRTRTRPPSTRHSLPVVNCPPTETCRPTMDTLSELRQRADDLTELGDTATAALVRQAIDRFSAWKFEAGERKLERVLEEGGEHEPPRSPYFNTCVLAIS